MKAWVAYHQLAPDDEPEVEVFGSSDALWTWLEPLARSYMADGDFDEDGIWCDKAELGILTRDPQKVCDAVNGSFAPVYKGHGPFLVVVEREVRE